MAKYAAPGTKEGSESTKGPGALAKDAAVEKQEAAAAGIEEATVGAHDGNEGYFGEDHFTKEGEALVGRSRADKSAIEEPMSQAQRDAEEAERSEDIRRENLRCSVLQALRDNKEAIRAADEVARAKKARGYNRQMLHT